MAAWGTISFATKRGPAVGLISASRSRCILQSHTGIRQASQKALTRLSGPRLSAKRQIVRKPCGTNWNIAYDIMDLTMAGNLHVRNLDDALIARLKRRAARHGRSTEAEHREILRQALAAEVEPSFDALAAELRELTKRRKQTPSEVLLREGRDER